MATREPSLRGQEMGAQAERADVSEKLSMVVDRPSPSGRGLLILPFATPRGDEVLGRQVGLLVQNRLSTLTGLVTGHGLLVATGPDGRRYVPLYHPLSAEQALSCGISWRATAVLSGSLTLRPTLKWALTLRDVNGRTTLFEDTLVGETEDLLDAPGEVATAIVSAIGMSIGDAQRDHIERQETRSFEALLLYLSAADLRPQHAVTQVDPKRARSQLLSAIEIDPTFRAPIEMLTAELVRTPGNDTALEGLIVAMEALGAPGVSAMVTLARALENDGHAEQSASVASAVLGRHPAHVDALALAGQHAYRAGQFDRARTIIQALTAIDPESAVPYALQGNLLAAGNRIPGAAIQWELSLSYDPDQPRVLLRLGSYMATIGEHQRAYDILLRADQLGASTADSLYQLGVAAYRLGLIADATAALEMACKMNAELSYIHIMLARCYVRAGNDEKATTHDQRALQLLPSYWPSALAVGYNALNQGRLAEALQAYAQVARARPDLPEALYGLGIALVANDMLDDGLATLVRAHELQGDNVAILCALTLTYLRAGLLDEARASIYDAMFLAPNNEEVAHCIAEVHRHTH